MTTTCINLLQTYGHTYRVELNQQLYLAEPEDRRTTENPWHCELLCINGTIYPHGGELLGVATRGRSSIRRRIAELDCTTVTQNGDDGINATFHVNDFDQVAAIMKPRKRRRLTPERRAELIEAGKSHRFTGAQSLRTEQESTITP